MSRGIWSNYDISPRIERDSYNRRAYENEAERRTMAKQYGFELPTQQSPEERFFAAASKYMGGASAAPASTPNYYETRLRALLDNPSGVENTGGYKFAFGQGQQALERSAAAKGMLNSGNVLAELVKYGQGMASQQYGSEMDRLANLTQQANQFALGREQNQTARESNRIRDLATMYETYNKQPRFIIA